MRAGAGERQLRWAFGVALALHGLALVAAARLPAETARDSDLDQIQVFDKTAPVVVAPVDLVEWSPPPRPAPEERVSLPAVPERPAPAVQARPRPKAPPERHAPSAVARVTTAAHRPPERAPTPTPRQTAQATNPRGGGGGSASPDLGARSPGGDLQGPRGGGTPPGSVPGSGARPGGAGEQDGGGAGVQAGGGAGGQMGGGGDGQAAGGGGGGNGNEKEPQTRKTSWVGPQVLQRPPEPEYPQSATERGARRVALKVMVKADGSVADVTVTKTSGDRRLDQVAKEWVRHWRFRPATQDGRPVPAATDAEVEFAPP